MAAGYGRFDVFIIKGEPEDIFSSARAKKGMNKNKAHKARPIHFKINRRMIFLLAPSLIPDMA